MSAGGLAVLGFTIMFWAGLGGVAFQQAAQAAPSAVDQCNGIATTAGLEVTCDVTVVNNLNLVTDTSSSTVTLTVCQGAANVTPTCATPTVTTFTGLTTSVTQCNGSVLGGGGVIICDVNITNNITGDATATAATVNQCNGSGQGGGVAVICDPTASTTGATITQCNGSGNGGAGVSVTCTVNPSTQSAALPVTVNQCIGSGNGGGSVVTCTVSLTNQITPAVVVVPPVVVPPVVVPPVVVPPVVVPPVVVPAPPVVQTPPVVTAPGVTAPVVTAPGSSGGNGPSATTPGQTGRVVNAPSKTATNGVKPRTSVITAPVLAPPLRTSSFTPPAGLTGDSAPQAGHTDPLLWGLALGCLSAGLLLIVVRPHRR